MEERLLNYLITNNDVENFTEHRNRKERFHKELEAVVLDYVSSNTRLTTNKVKALEDMEKVYMEGGQFYFKDTCQTIESISPEGVAKKLYDIVRKVQEQNDILNKIENLLSKVFEDIEFLSMNVTLISLFEKKKEDFMEHEKYEAILSHYKKLPEIMEFLGEKNNVQIESVKECVPLSNEELDRIVDGAENLFNVRKFGQNISISLSPKGRKVQKHIRQRQNKIYSAEEMENFIYINSHYIMKSFCSPLEEIPDRVFAFPLSPQRKRKLSLEYRLIRKEIEIYREVIDAESNFMLWPDDQLAVIDFNDMEDKREDDRRQEFDRVISGTITGYSNIGG